MGLYVWLYLDADGGHFHYFLSIITFYTDRGISVANFLKVSSLLLNLWNQNLSLDSSEFPCIFGCVCGLTLNEEPE